MNQSKYQAEFLKVMRQLSIQPPVWQVWADFVTMFAVSISNALDQVHAPNREKCYLNTIQKYPKDEQELFPKLAGYVILAMEENKEQDFLGSIYMQLNLSNHWKGQFFTPYHIGHAIARMNAGSLEDEIREKGTFSVLDPTCGSEVLLLAYANAAENILAKSGSKYNWQNHILFCGQDIDEIVAKMCYIQLSLMGCAGYVKIGNSLTEPLSNSEALHQLDAEESDYWYTPMCFSQTWQMRWAHQQIAWIAELFKKAPMPVERQIKTAAKALPVPSPTYKTNADGQMSFI